MTDEEFQAFRQKTAALAEEMQYLISELDMQPELGTTELTFNPRLKTTAGRAFPRKRRIELHPGLYFLMEEPRRSIELSRTMRHELAHLIAYERWGDGILPHGPEWQEACDEVGIPGESATHSLPWAKLYKTRQRRKWILRCPHCKSENRYARRPKLGRACGKCCDEHNGGKFDNRFVMELFVEEDA